MKFRHDALNISTSSAFERANGAPPTELNLTLTEHESEENNDAELEAVFSMTSRVIERIQRNRVKWDGWAREQLEQCEKLVQVHLSSVKHRQETLDDTAQELLSYQFQETLNLSTNGEEKQSEGHDNREEEPTASEFVEREIAEAIEKLRDNISDQESTLAEVQNEAKRQESRVAEAQNLATGVEDSNQTKLRSLQHGLDMCRLAGIDFHQAPDEQLQLVFTQIDSNDPERDFSFLICVNDDDLYEIRDCSPEVVPAEQIEALVVELNYDNDMGAFIRGIRQAFYIAVNL